MPGIEITAKRIGSDVHLKLSLADSGVSIAWDTVEVKQVCMYSVEQKAFAGHCSFAVDREDNHILNATYPASEQLYLGDHRVVVRLIMDSVEATYDALAFTLKSYTDAEGSITTNPVEIGINVEEVDTTIMHEILAACQAATDDALAAETAIAIAEAARVEAEDLRVAAENARAAAETARQNAESLRASAEVDRTTAENARAVAEAARVEAEDLRVAAENARAAAETARQNAESLRAAAEVDRAAAENARAAAEVARENAEAERVGQSAADHTRAESDHSTAAADHTRAESDHFNAAVDHSIAAADHTTAEDDHAIVQGYDTRLTNVEGEVSQLGQKVSELPLQLFDGIVNGYNVWQLGSNKQHFLIPVNGGESVVFDAESNYMYCAFLKTYTTPVAGSTPDFCTGYESRQGRNGASGAFNLPEDCRYFVINIGLATYIPTKLEINGVDIVNGAYGGIFNVGKKITTLDNESVKKDDIKEDVVSINLADPESVIDGKFINSSGVIGTNASWAMLKIPAVPGKYYTIGGLYLGRSVYYAFYDSSDSLISFNQISDPNGRVSPQTTTIAPENTAYLYVDIKTNSSPSNPYQYMQVNEGTYLQPYNKYVGGVVRVFDKKIVGEDYELGKVVNGALFRNPEKHNDFVNTGYVVWGTGALSSGGYGTTDFIPVKEGETVVVKDLNASSSVAGLSAYSSDSESSYLQLKSVKGTNSDATFNYVVPNGVNYIRLSRGNSNTVAEYGIIPYVPYLSKDDVADDISSADDKVATIGIVKEQTTQKSPVRLYPQTKLPCVSFQFDDCPNSDSDVVTLFDSYGLTCAFAFIASEENIVSKAERYRFYQQKGFQIMNHSVDGTIFNTTNYTYQTALTTIMTALNRIQRSGMICNGFVSPSSSMATEFLPILKSAHAYAFTSATTSATANGRSQDTCQLHRYSMESNTLATIKSYIDDCITNDQIVTLYGHTHGFGNTYSGEEWNIEKVAEIIEYCIAKRDAGLLYVGGTDDCVKYFFDL